MAQSYSKNLRLQQSDEEISVKGAWYSIAISAFLASLLFVVLFRSMSGFNEIDASPTMLAASVLFCVVYTLMLRFGRERLFYIAILLMLFLNVLFFRQKIALGFSLFWNQLGQVWIERTGWVLPALETVGDEAGALFLFSAFVGGIIALFSCFLAEKKGSLLSVLLMVVFVTGMLLFRQGPSFTYLLPLLVGSVLLLFFGAWGKRKFERSVLLSWLCMGLGLALALSVALSPALKAKSAEFSAEFKKNYHEKTYETEYTTLPEGDFSDYEEISKEVQPALVVTMKYPEEMYLRGFTAAVFENDGWKEIDSHVLAENKELLYWLNLEEFNPTAQFSAAVFDSDKEKNSVTVQNIGACSKYRYVPFSLFAGADTDEENLFTDSVESDGERIYTFTSVANSSERVQSVLETLKTSNDETVTAYRKAESAYRDYVKENYLQIPQVVLSLLEEKWLTVANGQLPENLTAEQAQLAVVEFLNQCFPEDGETVNFPLPLSTAADSEYQKATVAVLTLRYFGIPARYAEGYIVTEEMFALGDDSNSVRLDSSNGSAWAEVYQDGIGWLPVNLTEGMGELKDELLSDEDSQSGGGLSDIKEGEELEEAEAPTEEPKPEGGTTTQIDEIAKKTVWFVLLLILLLLFAMVIRRAVILKHKNKKFTAEDCSEAVSWIYADTALMLEELGLSRGNGSMFDLCEAVKERYGQDYSETFRHITELNAQALFSSK
ncbi:MAG: transglutaminase domain-containing protein [Ruminococcaceae bacterium]|nr:transglutaminase domain-containing protein [Oscillospiraceae bacterium]